MSSLDACAMLRPRALARISHPPVAAFQRDYVSRRRPVVLPGLVSDWPATRTWSLDSLHAKLGNAEITAIRADAGKVIMDGERGSIEERMPLGDFIEALRGGRRDLYVTSRLNGMSHELRHEAPPPPYCAEAAWLSSNLWVGGEGTIARMHRDLADNLHGVVMGRKRFTLVAPRHSMALYPHGIFDAFPNGCRVDIETPDFTAYPRLAGIETLVAELGPGDAIYIPRRWWHHVRTLELTVSVNYWWAGGARRVMVLAADYFKRIRGISR